MISYLFSIPFLLQWPSETLMVSIWCHYVNTNCEPSCLPVHVIWTLRTDTLCRYLENKFYLILIQHGVSKIIGKLITELIRIRGRSVWLGLLQILKEKTVLRSTLMWCAFWTICLPWQSTSFPNSPFMPDCCTQSEFIAGKDDTSLVAVYPEGKLWGYGCHQSNL